MMQSIWDGKLKFDIVFVWLFVGGRLEMLVVLILFNELLIFLCNFVLELFYDNNWLLFY